MSEQTALLAGVRVVDLGDEATARAGALLAELGAEVVRVEDPAGDAIRRSPKGPVLHAVVNAGKRSVALRTDPDHDTAALGRLLAAADVVIGPLAAPPAVQRLLDELDDAEVGVVEVRLRRDSTAAEDALATDLLATAAGGLLQLCGSPGDPPAWPAGELAWQQTSLVAAEAALALVLARRRSGRAGRIVVSVQEAVDLTTLQTANANLWHWHRQIPGRHTQLAGGTTWRSADGRWVSFTIHPPNFAAFADWVRVDLGRDEFCGPEWSDLGYVGANRARTTAAAAELCARLGRDQLVTEGQRRGLLVLPVQDLDEVAADAHLLARGFFTEVDGVALAGSPFLRNGRRAALRAAPRLGECDPAERLAAWTRRPASAVAASPAPTRRPLEGVRILDFCWAIAGPLTTRLLADLGADVIKVESEHRLDPIRYIGTMPADRPPSWNTNGQFNDCNVNKRAVTLNLNTAEGVELARELARGADVVTANYTPDRLDRWGLGYDTLRAARPDLIMVNLAVMGTFGPNKDWRSYGSGIVAMCGLAARTGPPGRDPICLGTLHTDFTVPYFAASQVLAALLHRDRTGEGGFYELAQYESAVRLLDVELAATLAGRAVAPRSGNADRFGGAHPHGVHPCRTDQDGTERWVAIACRDEAERAALARCCGGLDDASIAAWTAARTASEAAAELTAAAIPAGPVRHLRDLLEGGGCAVAELALDDGLSALVRHEPITWDGRRLALRRAPQWFEHTWEVLVDELGVDPERFADLLERGVLY
ncbi:MAG: CoA transferase [Acidimicrobiia bacterium]